MITLGIPSWVGKKVFLAVPSSASNDNCASKWNFSNVVLYSECKNMVQLDSLPTILLAYLPSAKSKLYLNVYAGMQYLLTWKWKAVGMSLNGFWGMVEDMKAWKNVVQGVGMGQTRLRNNKYMAIIKFLNCIWLYKRKFKNKAKKCFTNMHILIKNI